MTLLFVITAVVLSGPVPRYTDSLHVEVTGRGTPVVFLPGLLGSAYGFRHVIGELDPARYRSIVIEPLGFGASARPEGADYSLTAQADRLAEVLDTLASGPALIVAHSVSASIAYRLAYRHPRQVQAIVSIEGGPSETIATPGLRIAMKFAPAFRVMGARALMALVREHMTRASADEGWITERLILQYTEGIRRDYGAALGALRAMVEVREPERLLPNLSRIVCPVLLMMGGSRHASAPSPEAVAHLARTIAGFSVDSVPGAGHFVHEEAPSAVVAAIRRLTADAVSRRAAVPGAGSRASVTPLAQGRVTRGTPVAGGEIAPVTQG